MSALDLSLEDIIKQRAKPAQKTAKAKPRRAAARAAERRPWSARKPRASGPATRAARSSTASETRTARRRSRCETCRTTSPSPSSAGFSRPAEQLKHVGWRSTRPAGPSARATITFANPREAQAARTRYDGETLDGRALEVRLATARPGTRGGGAAPTGNVREGPSARRSPEARPRPGARRPRSQEGRTRGSPRPRPRAHGHGQPVDTARLSAGR